MALVSDIALGDEVKFSTIIPNDNNLYHGRVVSISSYEAAKFYNDVHGINSQAQIADPTIPDAVLLEYFLIDLLDPINSQKTMISIAKRWISEASLLIIATQNKVDVTIHDAGSADTDTILGLLASAGFKAVISRVY